MTGDDRERIRGTWYAVGAFSAWGVLPLYWKALSSVPSTQILAHRILWSCAYLALILIARRRLAEAGAAFSGRRYQLTIVASALTIGVNWFIYIWAVNADHVIETSLGYFINPIVSILFGMVFLRERLNALQLVAVGLVTAGVLYMTVRFGRLPWIALALAASFGTYGLLRKVSHADSPIGLFLETAILAPAALVFLALKTAGGEGAFGSASFGVHLLLACSGVVTATPLLWFAHGARRIPLSTVGFTQYLAPTFQFALGVFVFREPFTRTHLVSFSLIWCAIALYVLSRTRLIRRRRPGLP